MAFKKNGLVRNERTESSPEWNRLEPPDRSKVCRRVYFAQSGFKVDGLGAIFGGVHVRKSTALEVLSHLPRKKSSPGAGKTVTRFAPL